MPGYDATAELAAERAEPMTSAEHAAANGLESEHYRDVPKSCTGIYQWFPSLSAYKLIAEHPDCPWHANEWDRAELLHNGGRQYLDFTRKDS